MSGQRTVQDHASAASHTTSAVSSRRAADRIRPSNCHVPVALIEPLEALCSRTGMSHGDAIIAAIEHAYPRFAELIEPAGITGGNVFAPRPASRTARHAHRPLTPLNYRLREADFRTLDDLVEFFGASSRGHLITVALTDYLA